LSPYWIAFGSDFSNSVNLDCKPISIHTSLLSRCFFDSQSSSYRTRFYEFEPPMWKCWAASPRIKTSGSHSKASVTANVWHISWFQIYLQTDQLKTFWSKSSINELYSYSYLNCPNRTHGGSYSLSWSPGRKSITPRCCLVLESCLTKCTLNYLPRFKDWTKFLRFLNSNGFLLNFKRYFIKGFLKSFWKVLQFKVLVFRSQLLCPQSWV